MNVHVVVLRAFRYISLRETSRRVHIGIFQKRTNLYTETLILSQIRYFNLQKISEQINNRNSTPMFVLS